MDEFFGGADINGDGLLNGDEFRRSDAPEEITFNQIDSTEDGFIEYSEVVAHVCNCENELTFLMDQLPETTSVEFFSTLEFKNDIDVKSLDLNKDSFISGFEIEKAIPTCITTYNPFDSDGDGVPDKDDQFPNNPDEQTDGDGDGIGDNADFAPSVANDVIYGAGGAVLIVLIGLLVLFLRGGGGSANQRMEEEWNKADAFSEQMLGMNDEITTSTELPDAPQLDRIATDSTINESPSQPVYDFGQANIEQAVRVGNDFDVPSSSLMGMMDGAGRERIEYPPKSGNLWHRDEPDTPWIKD